MAGTLHAGFRLILDLATDQRASSEEPCHGENEFAPWVLGDTV